MAAALACLREFGIDMPAHPTEDQVQAEYEAFWQTLNGRPIESLIDLPLMTDPELLAAMQVLSVLPPAARFTDLRLCCLAGLPYGEDQRAARDKRRFPVGPMPTWGMLYWSIFHRNSEGYRFAKLACDLVEKHGFIASRAKVYLAFGGITAWTQPIATAIDFSRSGIRAAIETGDPTYACIGMFISITDLLLRNDHSMWCGANRR